jgi:hypothetical protein
MYTSYSREQTLNNVETILKEHLNTCIAEVNNRYDDGIVIDIVPVDDKHFIHLYVEDPNKSPLVRTFFTSTLVEPNQETPAIIDTITIDILFPNKNANKDYIKVLRYNEAIKNTLQNCGGSFDQRIELVELPPEPFALENDRVSMWHATILVSMVTA